MDESPISLFELLGRNVTYPVSYNVKKNIIKPGRFYPFNRPDKEHPEFFTNKISMVRLCKCPDDGGDAGWTTHVVVAEKYNEKRRRQKKDMSDKSDSDSPRLTGFYVVRSLHFRDDLFSLTPAPNPENPFHMHAEIRNYRETFREVKSVGELLPDEVRYHLDMLQRKAFLAEVDIELQNVTNASSPCSICHLI